MKKIDVKLLWKTKKKLILGIAAGVTAAAAGCIFWYQAGHSSKEPVYVYPFQYIGMTEYWGDTQESYGPVTTDKIQTVFLSDTQTVTEILVQADDEVKKGDLLMTFDTTLSDLQLERKRLDVEKLKLQLEDAKDELRQINSMKPMEVPDVDEDAADETKGVMLTDSYMISSQRAYDGSSADKALICWIRGDRDIDNSVYAAIEAKAEQYQLENQPVPTEPEEIPDDMPEETPGEIPEETPEISPEPPPADTDPVQTLPEPETVPPQTEPVAPSEEERLPSSASASKNPRAKAIHVVFKVTAGNMSLGEKVVWQGMRIVNTGISYSIRLENASIPDHMMVDLGSDDTDTPDVDFGSGYTAAQIAQMRSDQQKKIKDLEFQVRMADAEYKIMQKEISDGNVYADNDGKVVSLLTEEEARQTRQPILKVSGGGGFYVEGFVSELEKSNMKPGQEVTVNDWNTGMTYVGKVESIGDFPTRDGYYNGSGNPNASYYPFMVFVDETADLQEGSYVSVQYSSAESENGIYLENPFLRTEKGKSYVLVLGADGKLEQRWVTTGKSLWGSYTEILDNLTAEDLIAFPYGKNVKPGVAAEEGDMSNLYG